MGGTVAVTIKKDGQLKKMARKTGSYDYMFFSQAMLEGDLNKAYQDYCQIFDEMRDDFLSGEPYEMPMSPVYGWCEQMIPVDYGLVFIDFDKKEIHSMQGYDTPASFMVSEVMLPYYYQEQNEDSKVIEQFLLHDKVNICIPFKNNSIVVSIQEFFKQEPVEVLTQIKQSIQNKKAHSIKDMFPDLNSEYLQFSDFIQFQLKDWHVTHYSEDIEGIASFYHNVESLLSNEEKAEWKKYAEHTLEDYYDDTVEQMEANGDSEEVINDYIEKTIQKLLTDTFSTKTSKKMLT